LTPEERRELITEMRKLWQELREKKPGQFIFVLPPTKLSFKRWWKEILYRLWYYTKFRFNQRLQRRKVRWFKDGQQRR